MNTIWDRLKYFKPYEKWGDPSKMSGTILMVIDAIRDIVGVPFLVTCGYEINKDRQIKKSRHMISDAVDFIITTLPAQEAYQKLLFAIKLLQIDDTIGLGIYPYWKPQAGYHLDVRGERARWGGLTIRDGKGNIIRNDYVAYDVAEAILLGSG